MTDFLTMLVSNWETTSMYTTFGPLWLGDLPYGNKISTGHPACRLTPISGVPTEQTRGAAGLTRILDIVIQFDIFSTDLWEALAGTDAIKATYNRKPLHLTSDGNFIFVAERESWQQEDQKIFHAWVQFRAKVTQAE